jgi:hypothetical protein
MHMTRQAQSGRTWVEYITAFEIACTGAYVGAYLFPKSF